MQASNLFHLEFEYEGIDGYLSYRVYSCPEWKRPNLEFMQEAGDHRFVVLHSDPLDERDIMTLERAYVDGVMSAVNVIAKHETSLELFLDGGASSTAFPAIESGWTKAAELDPHWSFSLTFANQAEALSGRSDYPFWEQVKAVIELHSLGIKPYDIPVIDPASVVLFDPDTMFTSEIGICSYNTKTAPPIAKPIDCFSCPPFKVSLESIYDLFGHNTPTMTDYYRRRSD